MKDLNKLYQSFETGIRSPKSEKPRQYLKTLGLDYNSLRIGFNSGQFHHSEPQEAKDHYESLGILKKSNANVRKTDMTAYKVFGSYGIVFPLLDKAETIVNLFAIRFNLASPVEEYLNTGGLYPCYPHSGIKRLFLTPTLLDAASLLQSKALDQREAVLALHNGELLPQHHEAIASLRELEEIIIIKY